MRATGAGLAPSVRRRGEISPCDIEHFASLSHSLPRKNTRRDPLGLSALQIAARLSLGLSPFAFAKVPRLGGSITSILSFQFTRDGLAPSPGRHPVYQIGAALTRPCTIFFTIAIRRAKNVRQSGLRDASVQAARIMRSFERLARTGLAHPHPRRPAPRRIRAPPPRRRSATARAPQIPPGSPAAASRQAVPKSRK